MLQELVKTDKWKVISVEMPVEQRLPGVEQLSCDTLEEYDGDIKSTIHSNPDFLYITEIRDITGKPTVQVTNTGKCVLSTIHANSVADCISRLVDVTGYSADRVIQTLHSIMYQELVRDEKSDTVRPRNRFVHLSNPLKYELYGKSMGDIIKIIEDREDGDDGIF
jgi:type II secretory ATPase GspE/PulE/Tfp pilus assembly ATPase PilB-like protein